MKTILDDDRGATLFQGDAIDLDLPENCIDAIVFDPPAAISFMGAKWDDDRGGYDGWTRWLATQLAPAYRALKPGGHGLAWALPRTSHWTARSIELAGFEIRDMHHDLLSLDEAIEGFVESLDAAQRTAFVRVIEGLGPTVFYQIFGQGFPKSLTSNSSDIPEWAGTAMKPAVEHWIMFRKPLDGTVAENYARWGTGVLRIGPCRIGTDDTRAPTGNRPDNGWGMAAGEIAGSASGRWPAHLSLDEAGAAELDAQAGELRSGGASAGTERGANAIYGKAPKSPAFKRDITASKGGPSRFFYVAKPARKEKDANLDHLPASTGGEATGRTDGAAGVLNPRAGAGRTGGARNVHPTVKSISLMSWLIDLVTPTAGVVLDPFAGSGTTGVAAIAGGRGFVGVEQGGPCATCGKDLEHCTLEDHQFEPKYIPILLGRIVGALEKKG